MNTDFPRNFCPTCTPLKHTNPIESCSDSKITSYDETINEESVPNLTETDEGHKEDGIVYKNDDITKENKYK
jgi:hypothetical protein